MCRHSVSLEVSYGSPERTQGTRAFKNFKMTFSYDCVLTSDCCSSSVSPPEASQQFTTTALISTNQINILCRVATGHASRKNSREETGCVSGWICISRCSSCLIQEVTVSRADRMSHFKSYWYGDDLCNLYHFNGQDAPCVCGTRGHQILLHEEQHSFKGGLSSISAERSSVVLQNQPSGQMKIRNL